MRVIDLTRTMQNGMEAYPGDVTGLAVEHLAEFPQDEYALSRLSLLHAHCGTHFDSPRHFIADGADVSEVRLTAAPIVLITTGKHKIGPDELARGGDLSGKAVLINTGWDSEIGTDHYYRDYPHLTSDGARFLRSQGIAILGLDTPSPDPPDSPDYPVHHIILGAGIPIVEGLVGLNRLVDVAHNAVFIAFPLKIQRMEASPVRAAALLLE